MAGLLADRVSATAPHLVPWLPLLGIPMDVVLPPTPETRELDGQFRKARLEAVVVDLLAAVLTAPTILVFEDTHLMDDASSDLLRRLAQHVDRPTRGWSLVTRRDAADGFVPDRRRGSRRCGSHPWARPRPARSSQARSGDLALSPSARAALAAQAAGNPLFLEALVLEASRAGSVSRLPESVEGLVTSQIDRLDPADRLVLRYAAVLGTDVDEAALDGLLDTHDARVPSGAMTRLADFLVRDQPGRLRFRNALLRDVAYEGLPYSRRETLHDHVGRAIEEAATDPEDQCELLSLHYFHAGRARAGMALLAAGRGAGTGEVRARARPSSSSSGPRARRSRHCRSTPPTWVGCSSSWPTPASWSACRRRRRRPTRWRAGGSAATPYDSRASPRRRRASTCAAGRFPQAMRRISRGLHGLDGIPGPAAEVARSLLARRYAYCRFSQGRIDEALRWAEVARRAADDAADEDALAQAHEMLNAIYAGSGREEPVPYGALALQAYTDLGNLPRQGHCLNNLAVQAFTAGQWDVALTSYRRATDLFRRIGDTAAEGNAAFNQAELLVCQRRHAEAAALLPEVLHIARAVDDEELVALALREQARTLAAPDDLDGAVAVLRTRGRASRRWASRARCGPPTWCWSRCCWTPAGTRRREPRSGSWRAAADSDRSASEHRVLGRHHAAGGRTEEALLAVRRGLEVAARASNRYEEGLLLLELAALRGREADAGASDLARAREILGSMGVLVG